MRNNAYKAHLGFPSSPKIPQSQVVQINYDDTEENQYQSKFPQTQRNNQLRETISYKSKSPFVLHSQCKDEGQKSMQNFYKRSRAGQQMESVGLAVSTVKKVAEDNIKLVEERQALFKKNCELVNQINALKKKSINEHGTKKQLKSERQQYIQFDAQQNTKQRKSSKFESSIMDIKKPYSSRATEDNGLRNTPVNKFKQQQNHTSQEKFFKNKHRYKETQVVKMDDEEQEYTQNYSRQYIPKQSYVSIDPTIKQIKCLSPKDLPYKFRTEEEKYYNDNQINYNKTNKYSFPSEDQIYFNEKTTPYPSNVPSTKSSRLLDKAMSPTIHRLPYPGFDACINKCQSNNCLQYKCKNQYGNSDYQQLDRIQNMQYGVKKSLSPFSGQNKFRAETNDYNSDKYLSRDYSPYSPRANIKGSTVGRGKNSEVFMKKQQSNKIGLVKVISQKKVQTIQQKIRRVKYQNSQLRNQMLN